MILGFLAPSLIPLPWKRHNLWYDNVGHFFRRENSILLTHTMTPLGPLICKPKLRRLPDEAIFHHTICFLVILICWIWLQTPIMKILHWKAFTGNHLKKIVLACKSTNPKVSVLIFLFGKNDQQHCHTTNPVYFKGQILHNFYTYLFM